ncbi:MAG: UDP-N-acetylglucosamine 1-carboxyvinyltransferase [Firmicutes bacterium]|nr:UDP-N-acetylglucosamine 1-carboxyvinyltransferase [Bacillota bacterium]
MPFVEKLIINGGRRLTGDVQVAGGKNTSLPILSAALLCDEPVCVDNIPDIEDVHTLLELLRGLGALAQVSGHSVMIDPTRLHTTQPSSDLCKKMRGSYYLLGALLGKAGQGSIPYPGGCDLGARPIDQHLKGFRALGVEIDDRFGWVDAKAASLNGSEIFFDLVTVGGTINVMLAAARAKGSTVIYNAAKEPHVVDTANFLNSMGARVRGAGTDVIRIRGVDRLHASTYTVIPDQIETGTLMIAAAATQGDVAIHGCIPAHMESLTAKLLEIGVRVDEADDVIRIRSAGGHRAVNIKTLAYPGFPTDLQSPMSALLTTAVGTSIITETIFDKRFRHLHEMVRMGARARISDWTSVIEGMPHLTGAPVTASDLRAGAALVIAGLMAGGNTEISNPQHIDRGYEKLETRLRSLGADIQRVAADS